MRLRARSNSSRGQILPLFVLCLTVILLVSALLMDASMALMMRRQDQTVADAAALAAANVIQSLTPAGCSLTASPAPGAARVDVVNAAKASVLLNLPAYDPSKIVVTCPNQDAYGNKYGNSAVQVSLHGDSPGFFSKIVGINSFAVDTSATAINGQVPGATWSVSELDPYNSTWSNGKQGCPSVMFSGGPTVTFEGSVHVNSLCPAGSGGAMGTNGNSATLTFNNGGGAFLAGGFAPGPLTITPPPQVNQGQIGDTLAAGLPNLMSESGLAVVHGPGTLVLNNTDQILSPGIYQGGIQLKNTSRAFLKPGVYVIQGGGFDLGAHSSVYSVKSVFNNADMLSFTDATWATYCPVGSCGVLIYNTGTQTGPANSALTTLSIGAGANLKLLPYNDAVAGNNVVELKYKNLLLWQPAAPLDTLSYQQPIVSLGGGGSIDIRGTVYTPSAEVYMTGGSGGFWGASGGVTIQFISWDLTFQGNTSFHFLYEAGSFTTPMAYGLVQ